MLGFVVLAASLILGTAPNVGAGGQGGGATLNVRIADTPVPVEVANVPGVNVANTPSVTVANIPSVNVSSLPAVNLATGTTVKIDSSELFFNPNRPVVGAISRAASAAAAAADYLITINGYLVPVS